MKKLFLIIILCFSICKLYGQQVPISVISSGCVGCWRFNEGTGAITYNEPYLLSTSTGEVVGISWVSTKYGYGLYNTGANNKYVKVYSPDKLIGATRISITIRAKIKVQYSAYSCFIQKFSTTGANNSDWMLMTDNTGLYYFAVYGTNGVLLVNDNPAFGFPKDEGWHTFTAVYNGDSGIYMLDKADSATTYENINLTNGDCRNSTAAIYFGVQFYGGVFTNNLLNGTIEEVLIFNREISKDEHRRIHQYYENRIGLLK